MSYENPTQVQLGMAGVFAGKRYRVAGRVVLGVEDGGQIYYWNEFNLVSEADDEHATLVYELSDDGEMWRLFTMFEPVKTMSVEEAGAVQVNDRVNLEGDPVRVSLVDESQVYFIEGEAPEGVEVGDVANYFNAESGNKMLVVSWTGDEVEYYRGVTIRAESVAAALGFRLERKRQFVPPASADKLSAAWKTSERPERRLLTKTLVGFVVLVVGCVFFMPNCSFRRQPAVVNRSAPAVPGGSLAIGKAGRLGGKNYHVRGHAVVDIREVGIIQGRHEYLLQGDDDGQALLIYGANGRPKQWLLLEKLSPATLPRPQRVADLKSGEKFTVDDSDFVVRELFQSVVRGSDLSEPEELAADAITYRLEAETGPNILQARWGLQGITLHRGKVLSQKEVAAAFGN